MRSYYPFFDDLLGVEEDDAFSVSSAPFEIGLTFKIGMAIKVGNLMDPLIGN